MIIGGIELGGTKIVCGIGNEKGEVLDRFVILTASPNESLTKALNYFKDKNIEKLGIGSFGPIDLNKESKTYGYITTTPKVGWENTNVVGFFKELNVPIYFDTDVNVACLGEVILGAGKGLHSVVYVTVGTGIGFGVYQDGKLIHGLMHTEAGHMLIQKHEKDNFEGVCKYHSHCLEGLASGPAIEKRWGKKAEDLYDNEDVWKLEAYYLGQALANCIMCYSPQRIILGGGVMHNTNLLELVRKEVLNNLDGYIQKNEIINHIDDYIVIPSLDNNSGLIGSLLLGSIVK